MGDRWAPPTRDLCCGAKAGRVPLKGGVPRSRRQRNAVGGGERGAPPLPAPAPCPDAPRAGARRRDATEPSLSRHLPGCSPAPARRWRATRWPCYLHPPRCRPLPLPHPMRSGHGRRLPYDPPAPLPDPSPRVPTSSAASLAGRPRSKRADTGKFWGREGRALKGPRPLSSQEKKKGGGGRGGETERCSAVEWRKQRKKGTGRLSRPFSPNTPKPSPPPRPYPSQKVAQLLENHALILLVSHVLCWLR